MWIDVNAYLDKINEDSEKYYQFDEYILKITSDIIPLNLADFFLNDNQVYKLEIGFGNGDSLIELAKQNPNINYFGIDRKMDRVRTAHSKIQKIGKIPNLIIARTGTDYIREMFLENFFDEVIMNFPDPWPKKKHHKKRTIKSDFLDDLSYLLKEKGVYRFASDHYEYSMEVMEIFENSNLFEKIYYKNEVENRIPTQFEKHKKREGFMIHYLKFEKNNL